MGGREKRRLGLGLSLVHLLLEISSIGFQFQFHEELLEFMELLHMEELRSGNLVGQPGRATCAVQARHSVKAIGQGTRSRHSVKAVDDSLMRGVALTFALHDFQSM